MPLVDADNPRTRFAVSVWVDDDDEDGKDSYYTGPTEAEQDFQRLKVAGRFKYGALYDWIGGEDPWRVRDTWPEDFEG